MSDEQTRPDTDEHDDPAQGVSPGQAGEQPASTEAPEVPLPALDADDDPDALAGDFTDPDVDVDLDVEPDEDGGDDA